MTEKNPKFFRIGKHLFNYLSGELCDSSGNKTMLRQQTARVLEMLCQQPNQVVSREMLMETVWHGTAVTDDSLVQCVSEIRKALKSDKKYLTTLPRKGYRLDLEKEASRSNNFKKPVISGILIVAALIASIALGLFLFIPEKEQPRKPLAVAVLPFVNMGEETEQSYFSDGVAEDLIISLSKISDLKVTSRRTSFSINTDNADTRNLAKILDVDYILEGSVRRFGKNLRLSASLVHGISGKNVWAERYEGSVEELFSFQNTVLNELIRVLSVKLSDSERARLGVQGTESIDAHDAYLRGKTLENLYTKETNLAAEEALLEALGFDPKFPLAYAHLSQVYSFRIENNWTKEHEKFTMLAFQAANKSVKLDSTLPFAHFSLGRLYTRSFAANPVKALKAFEQAIELNPNYVDAYVFLANVHIFNGRAEDAMPLIDSAFERNPMPPYWYYHTKGMASYFLGRYEQAEKLFVIARDKNPTAPFPYRFLIATYGQLEKPDDAEWVAMEYENLGREATITALLDSGAVKDPKYREIWKEGFRKAGLSE